MLATNSNETATLHVRIVGLTRVRHEEVRPRRTILYLIVPFMGLGVIYLGSVATSLPVRDTPVEPPLWVAFGVLIGLFLITVYFAVVGLR